MWWRATDRSSPRESRFEPRNQTLDKDDLLITRERSNWEENSHAETFKKVEKVGIDPTASSLLTKRSTI